MLEAGMRVGVGFCDECYIRLFSDEHITYRQCEETDKVLILCEDCK